MDLVERVKIPARLVNQHIRKNVMKCVVEQAEGKWKPVGYIIAVVGFPEIDFALEQAKGTIDNTDGSVHYHVQFQAVVFKPFKNEVLSCVVTAVSSSVLVTTCGPVDVLVDPRNMPDDFQFDNSDPASPQFKSKQYSIMQGSIVKIRVINVTTSGAPAVVGTMNDNYLG